MTSWGLDLLSKLAESIPLDTLREDFPRKSDEGLNPAQFLAVVQKHLEHGDFFSATNSGGPAGAHGQGHGYRHDEAGETAGRVDEVFKQMDIRGDGDVSWDDFSAISRMDFLPSPVEKLGLVANGNEVVHLVGQGPLEDDDEVPFRVVSGGGSDLARTSCSLRHDTAYKPHEVNAVHSLPGQDVVITSSSLGPSGPHVLTVWDLPTEEERSSEKQFLPALTCREETPTRQTVIFWAPAVEMVLTGSGGNGCLLGWELGPLRQSAKLWLHDAGITHIHELVGHTGGDPHLVTASLDGTIAVCGGTSKAGGYGDGVLQRLQAHEKGVAHMAFCLQHSLALSAGVFVNTVETTPDVLVWRLDRDRGLLEHDAQTRLRGHEGQVVGIAFAEEELEVLTGGADGTFLVWQIPSLVLKQRFASSKNSPLVDQSVSCFSLVPRAVDRPLLLVAGMYKTTGLEIFARVEKRVHEALIKAEFCPYLQRFVTVSARRATVWDGKSGEALTTLTSERLLGSDQADITAFSLDHQGHKLVVGADTGRIRSCFSHSGSVIRQLDPHNGAVNWLAFASRKTDKCVFSVGGDGALHVLDDADAIGYVKPVSMADGRRKGTRNFSSHMSDGVGKGGSGKDDKADKKPCREGERRSSVGRGVPVPDGHGSQTRGSATTDAAAEETAAVVDHGRGFEAEGGKRNRDKGWSVLLRQIAFASGDSDDDGQDIGQGKSGGSLQPQSRGRWETGNGEPLGSDDHTSAMDDGSDSTAAVGSPSKPGFARAARALMSSSLREELLEKELRSEEKDGISKAGGKGLLLAKPRFDMTTCAADDHLSMIATAATSDGGIEAATPAKSGGNADHNSTTSTRVGRPSSSLHLWDAERLTLLGTLLLPCLALTRDLANAAAAFGIQTACVPGATRAVDRTESDPPPCVNIKDLTKGSAREKGHDHDKACQDEPTAASDTESGRPAAESTPSRVCDIEPPPSGNVVAQMRIPGAAVRAGTGLNRPALVNSLMFLSPYPLLVGASTGGAVVLWRASDCVCVQVRKNENKIEHFGGYAAWKPCHAILLPADLASLRKERRGSGDDCNGHHDGMLEEAGSGETEGHITCLARGTCTSVGGEVTVLYAGNGSGDVVVAHLSPNELAELSGDAGGPVPCQRRDNHNPYRAVRVKLTPQAARISFQAACRAQGRAVGRTQRTAVPQKRVFPSLLSSFPRNGPKRSPSDPRGGFNFAVPSSQFQAAWAAHSAAVSSLSWIDSPPSLLSSSADGLAKIWNPDGTAILGQLDINNRRPERPLPISQKGAKQWIFQPVPAADFRHQSDLESHHTVPGATSSDSTTSITNDSGARAEAAGEARCSHSKRKKVHCCNARHLKGTVEGEASLTVGDKSSVGSSTSKRVPGRGKSKVTPCFEARAEGFSNNGGEAKPGWMSGWDYMARQLKDFEETLEASCLARKKNVFHHGRPLSSAVLQPTKRTPLTGKRWRTKSAPWPTEDEDLLERSIFEQGLPTAGSVRVCARKNRKYYVRPCPGSAEDAALKRSRSRGATGMVLKDTVAEQARRTSFQGRPLAEWLAPHEAGRGFPTTGADNVGNICRGENASGGEGTAGKIIDGLPPVAILAGSHGGRLVASGITIAGNRGGGGFNVSAARAAARSARRDAALAQELAREEELERGRRDRRGHGRTKDTTTTPGGARQQRQGLRGDKRGVDLGASSWGWGQGKGRVLSRSTPPALASTAGAKSKQETEAKNNDSEQLISSTGGSLAPSFGGTAHSSGSIGSGGDGSVVVTEPPDSGLSVGGPLKGGAGTLQNIRGLNEDSVLWASTRRGSSRTSASSRNRTRKADGAGQVETIRRLVHMGLF
ncbi:unnamed protein product [Scytosiphon promiscuus]